MSLRALPLLVLIGAVTGGCRCEEPPPPPSRPTPLTVRLPVNVAPMPVPEDNPLTEQGVQLGRKLFYDPIMSGDNTMSCSSCHLQSLSFTDGRKTSRGVRAQPVRRNSMALVNLAWSAPYFWDGRAPTLEALVPIPIEAPNELDQNMAELVSELKRHQSYPAEFATAFPDEGVSETTIAKAVAQFLRVLVSFDSPMDRADRGEYTLTAQQQRGTELMARGFPKGDPDAKKDMCDTCHSHAAGLIKPSGIGLFTDASYRNNGLAHGQDRGRGEVTSAVDDRKFKVPTARNLSVTGPYMHDGRFATLTDVVRHYNTDLREGVDEKLQHAGAPTRLGLTDDEIADVVSVLEMLTDETFLKNPAFSNPFDAEGR